MKHIVVIDDDAFIRDLVVTALSDTYSVVSGADADEGLSLVHRNATDLVILDLEMPGRHGLAVLEELKNDHKTKSIPVIVFSNNDESEWEPKAKAAGASHFFVKVNLEMSELKNQVDHILA